jgi:phage gp36-like protein
MPLYVTLTKLKAALPAEITAQLLDDHGSGAPSPGVWDEVVAAVQAEIDGKLGMRYPVPLDPVPAVISHAAFVLAAEALYQRRNYHGDANPWTKRAEQIRGTQGQQGGQPGLLDRLASGEVPLTVQSRPARPAATAITETAKTTSGAGNLLC